VPGLTLSRPGDDPLAIARVSGDFLERLPGRGRVSLSSILALKWARRFRTGVGQSS
jgi:hypothetical protein